MAGGCFGGGRWVWAAAAATVMGVWPVAACASDEPLVRIVGGSCFLQVAVDQYCVQNWASTQILEFGLGTGGALAATSRVAPPCPSSYAASSAASLRTELVRADPADASSPPIGVRAWIDLSAHPGQASSCCPGPWTSNSASATSFLALRVEVSPPGATLIEESSWGTGQTVRGLAPGMHDLYWLNQATLNGPVVTLVRTITFAGGTVAFANGVAPTLPQIPDPSGCLTLSTTAAWISAPASPRVRVRVSEPGTGGGGGPGPRLTSITVPSGLLEPVRAYADGVLVGTIGPGETVNIGAVIPSGATVVELAGLRPAPGGGPGGGLPLWVLLSATGGAVCVEGLPCRADANNGGTVTIDDIFVYLNLWFASDPRADMSTPPNGVSIDDLFVFLNSWFAGC